MLVNEKRLQTSLSLDYIICQQVKENMQFSLLYCEVLNYKKLTKSLYLIVMINFGLEFVLP